MATQKEASCKWDLQKFSNPTLFFKGQALLLIPVWVGCALLFLFGLYEALFLAPPDYLQGEMVRVMFVHVPAASLSLGIYVFMAVMSGIFLIFRHHLASVAAKSAAPIGTVFAGLALATGAIWGKPTWGTYWVWDARIISMFVLFLFYLGYLAIWQALEERSKAAHAAAIMALVGVINVPIVRFSVDWWSTLHQGTSLGVTQNHIDPSMLPALLLMMAAYGALFFGLLLLRMRTEQTQQKLKNLKQQATRGL